MRTSLRLFAVFALGCAVLAGAYSSDTAGAARVYAGDALAIILFTGVLAMFGRKHREYISSAHWLALLLPLIGLFSDVANHVQVAVMTRGLGRNVIFSTAYLAGIGVAQLLPWRYLAAFALAWLSSQYAWEGVLAPRALSLDYAYAAKYLGLSYFPLLYLLIPGSAQAGVCAFAIGLGLAFALDARGAGLFHAVIGALLLIRALRTRLNLWFAAIVVAVVGVPVAVVILTSAKNFATDAGRLDRISASNSQRYLMMADCIDTFRENPFFGVGSYGVASRFLDALNQTSTVTVHSALFQYSAEYGAAALMLLVAACASAIWLILTTIKTPGGVPPVTVGFIFLGSTFWLLTAALVPFTGFYKSTTPLLFGIAWGLNSNIVRSRHTQIRLRSRECSQFDRSTAGKAAKC